MIERNIVPASVLDRENGAFSRKVLGKEGKLEQSPLEVARELLTTELKDLVAIAPENAKEREKKSSDIRERMRALIPDRSLQVDSILSKWGEHILKGEAEPIIKNKKDLVQFVRIGLETPKETQIRKTQQLGKLLGVRPKQRACITEALGSVSPLDVEQQATLIKSLRKFSQKISKNSEEHIYFFTDLLVSVYPKMEEVNRQILSDVVKNTIDQINPDIHHDTAIKVWSTWLIGLRDSEDLGGSDNLQYLERLNSCVSKDYFDEVGQVLKESLSDGSKPLLTILDQWPELLSKLHLTSPQQFVLDAIAMCYVETGFITRSANGDFRLTERGKRAHQLGYYELRSASLAYLLLDVSTTETNSGPRGWSDVKSVYEKFKADNTLDEVSLVLSKPDVRVAFLSGLLLGSPDADVDFATRMLKYYQQTSVENLPDVIVISEILAGGFQYRYKGKKETLVYPSVNDQFGYARSYIQQLEDLNNPTIIYNMGPSDFEVAHNYTIETMRMLRHNGKPLADRDKHGLTEFSADKLKEDKAWAIHKRFQQAVVFPYCLRSGRRLLSADEVSSATGGKVRMEEYLMLYSVYQALLEGWDPNPSFASIVNVQNLPLPGRRPPGFLITNDVRLTATVQEAI